MTKTAKHLTPNCISTYPETGIDSTKSVYYASADTTIRPSDERMCHQELLSFALHQESHSSYE